jgi:membrane protein YqaA with SNARE-associated domain
MSLIESYFFLFCDSFFSALILTLRSEMVVDLMIIFPSYDAMMVFGLSVLGSVTGSLANWQIGKFFLFLHQTEFFKAQKKEIEKAEEKWHQFLVYILLFSSMNIIGGPFAVLAGFFRTKFYQFVLLVLCGKAIYYADLVFFKVNLLG